MRDNQLRAKKKDEILKLMEGLCQSLDDYLILWKKSGGGTTGHAIGSTLKRIVEVKKFFENYC